MERLFYYPVQEPTPISQAPAGAQDAWFTSGDGTRLYGWFIPARGLEAGQKVPTVVHVHGNAGSIVSHIGFTDYLPAAGYNLFIFDYRGYGQSEGAARHRGPLIQDTHAAIDAARARPETDPGRIGFYGQSLGGAIALNVMAQRDDIRAAVIESAFTSWRDMAACAVGGGAPNIACRGLAALLISDAHRADDAIARINRPVLLLHGDADTIVPIAHSRRLAEAAGGHARLIELPGGDHNTLRQSHPQIEREVIAYLDRHLRNAGG